MFVYDRHSLILTIPLFCLLIILLAMILRVIFPNVYYGFVVGGSSEDRIYKGAAPTTSL